MSSGQIEFDPNPTVASRQIVGPSLRRTSIIFFPPSVGRVTLSNNPVAGDGKGYVLAAGESPSRFHVDTHGDMVRQAWHALYSAGATGVSWSQAVG